MAATTGARETYLQETKKPGRAFGMAFRKTWWLGLGVLATLGEQTTRAASALVDKGREVEPSVVGPMRNATAGFMGAAPGVRLRRATDALRDRVPTLLRRATSPTKEEFERLQQEVRSLRERLENGPGSSGS